MCLSTETVDGASLALEGIHNVKSGDGLALGVLGVGDGIADDVLQEVTEDSAGLLIDQTGDALDTTTARKAADGGLGDALDVVAQNLAVTLCASLSESLSSLSSSSHVGCGCKMKMVLERLFPSRSPKNGKHKTATKTRYGVWA